MPSFTETLPQAFDVVREIVNHVHAFAGAIDRDARIARHRADEREDVREHLHLIFRSCVQRIDEDRGDVPRRSRRVFRAIGVDAGRQRLRPHADGRRRRTLVVKERDVARAAASTIDTSSGLRSVTCLPSSIRRRPR